MPIKQIPEFQTIFDLVLKTNFLIYTKADFRKFQTKHLALNIYQSLLSLKELVKILKFTNTQKKFKIYLCVDNSYLFILVEFILKTMPHLLPYINVITSAYTPEPNSRQFSLIIVLGSSSKKFIKNSLFNEIFMVYIINDQPIKSFTGIYTMYNNFVTIQKIITLFVLLDKILITPKATNAQIS